MGDSSILFAYLFLLLFGQTDHKLYLQDQAGHLVFFLEGGFKGNYFREKNVTLSYVVSEV